MALYRSGYKDSINCGMMRLFCFGHGYVASYLSKHVKASGGQASGTTRSAEKAAQPGIYILNDTQVLSSAALKALANASHVLISIPPDADGGDIAFHNYADQLSGKWIGYLSTTGVYGDWQGEWVDERSPLKAAEPRSLRRIAAEEKWKALGASVFRLAGIYGPGRSPFARIHAGTAQRIDKPGQVFSRMHVEDIVQMLIAAMQHDMRAECFNGCDDEPAPSEAVIAYACELLGIAPPPLVPFEDAQLSPMAQSFYAANRRVRNDKIKSALGLQLTYPTYREGLASILHRERESGVAE